MLIFCSVEAVILIFQRRPALVQLDRIIRIRAVLDRTGLSRATLYRKMQKDTFPKRISINDACAGCRDSEVNKWIEDPVCWRPDKSLEKSRISMSA